MNDSQNFKLVHPIRSSLYPKECEEIYIDRTKVESFFKYTTDIWVLRMVSGDHIGISSNEFLALDLLSSGHE